MTERLIVKAHPRINRAELRDFSYCAFSGVREYIQLHWPEAGAVTPQTHPKVIELCAGDGPIARLFVEGGWLPQNVLCVDQAKTPTPMVPTEVRWVHWDVLQIGKTLVLGKREIPPVVTSHKGQFDIVTLENGNLEDEPEDFSEFACNYFARPGGLIYYTKR